MDMNELKLALQVPFNPRDVRWLPAATNTDKTKALAVAYLEAETIQDRLDEVFGPAGWQTRYEVLPDGCAVCTLQCFANGVWVEKQDVGSPSEQKDVGDKRKASFSDALKRVAKLWGIGRYLKYLPKVWCAYDDKKKQFTEVPGLPNWALPPGATQAPVKSAPASKAPAGAPAQATAQAATAGTAPPGNAPKQGTKQPPTTISINQQAELGQLLTTAGVSDQTLMQKAEHAGLPLAKLPEMEFDRAKDWLTKMIAKQHTERKAG